MPRSVSILLVVIAFASVTGLAWMLARPTAADPRVAALESKLSSAQKELARLRDQPTPKPAAAIPAQSRPDSAPEASANSSASAPAGAGKVGNLRDVLATPGMRAMMEQQQAMQIDLGYGRLYDVLQLNPEEKANFKQLLLEREKGQTDFALKMMDPNLTADQRKQLAMEMQTQRNSYDEKFKQFMNDPKDFSTFKQWEDTQPERVQFDMLGRTLFDQSGEPLTGDQEQKLIEAAAQVRKAPNAASDFTNPVNMDPSKMTDAAIQNYLTQLKANDDQVVAKAAGFLSATQVKTLQAYQEQARNMAQTSVKMGAALGGSSGK